MRGPDLQRPFGLSLKFGRTFPKLGSDATGSSNDFLIEAKPLHSHQLNMMACTEFSLVFPRVLSWGSCFLLASPSPPPAASRYHSHSYHSIPLIQYHPHKISHSKITHRISLNISFGFVVYSRLCCCSASVVAFDPWLTSHQPYYCDLQS